MAAINSDKKFESIYQKFKKISTGKKVILIVFLIWLIQAVPKWTIAITADGELSAKIMKVFITPG